MWNDWLPGRSSGEWLRWPGRGKVWVLGSERSPLSWIPTDSGSSTTCRNSSSSSLDDAWSLCAPSRCSDRNIPTAPTCSPSLSNLRSSLSSYSVWTLFVALGCSEKRYPCFHSHFLLPLTIQDFTDLILDLLNQILVYFAQKFIDFLVDSIDLRNPYTVLGPGQLHTLVPGSIWGAFWVDGSCIRSTFHQVGVRTRQKYILECLLIGPIDLELIFWLWVWGVLNVSEFLGFWSFQVLISFR